MDPIADMLTIIRNGQAVNKETVLVPYSKLKMNLAEILEREGLIKKVGTQGRRVKKVIEIKLKYHKDRTPAITNLRRLSKLGRRIYIKSKDIKPVRQGYGLAIISTSSGLMTNKEARKKGLGGEILCEVY